MSILLGLLFTFWLTISYKTQKATSKPLVVCTTTIIGDTIYQIAGDTINIEILMGPGVDPHLYKPIEQDVIKISQADIIFYNGLHLEARMGDLFEKMSSFKKTIAVSKDIPQELLIKSIGHGQFIDPHIWFDPRLWKYCIESITASLQTLSPKHYEKYQQNKIAFLNKLETTYHATYNEMLSIAPTKRILVTGHDAFSYFGQAYNCDVISLQGINTASEAGTKDVQNLINFIYNHKIPAIFVETSIPSRNIQALQQGVRARGFDVAIGDELFSDALGPISSKQGTYIGMLEYNVKAIIKGLK